MLEASNHVEGIAQPLGPPGLRKHSLEVASMSVGLFSFAQPKSRLHSAHEGDPLFNVLFQSFASRIFF